MPHLKKIMSGKQTLRGYAVMSTTGINKKMRMCIETRLIISKMEDKMENSD